MAEKAKTYELAFRIGGLLSRSFVATTDAAGKKLSALQLQSARLAAAQKHAAAFQSLTGAIAPVGTAALAVGAAAVGAAAGLFILTKRTADAADAADEDAQKLGISIEALQELRYAAARSGASAGDLDTALQKLSVSVGQAGSGSTTMQQAFGALGLSWQTLAAMSPDARLAAVADALQGVTDQSQRAALSQAILGRGSRQLGALLADGSAGLDRMREAARRTGSVLSSKTAKQASDFTDRLLDLQLTLVGLRNTVGAALIPVFTKLFERLAGWLQANQPLVQRLADRFAAWAGDVLPRLLDRLDSFVRLGLPGLLSRGADEARDLGVRMGELVGLADRVAQAFGGWGATLYGVAIGAAIFKGLQLAVAVQNVTAAIWENNIAMKASPVGIFVAVALLEVAAIALLVKHWDAIIQAWKDAGPLVKVVTGYLFLLSLPFTALPILIALVIREWDSLKAAARSVGEVASGALGGIVDAAQAVWDRVKAVVRWVGGLAGAVWDEVVLIATALGELGGMVLRPLIAVAGQVLSFFGGLIAAIWAKIAPGLVKLWGLVSSAAVFVVTQVVTALAPVIGVVLAVLAGAWAVIEAMWTGLVDVLGAAWARWGDGVLGVVGSIAAALLDLATLPARLGLGALAALPGGENAPALAKLQAQVAGLARAAAPPGMTLDTSKAVPEFMPTPLGAPLAGMARAGGSIDNSDRSVKIGAPVINVSVGAGADAAAVQGAVKSAGDDFLAQMQAALEQRQRLAF